MTGHQKIEGAREVHREEARVRMLMAIGQAPPLNEVEMMRHLKEFAHEVGAGGGGGCSGGGGRGAGQGGDGKEMRRGQPPGGRTPTATGLAPVGLWHFGLH
jgi:hypothetical protein